MPNFVKIGQSVANILIFFDFSRWRPSTILDLFGANLDNPQWVLGGLYHSAKFGYDPCSSFYNMNILIFDVFGWKMPIHAPKIGFFWAIWSPKWSVISTKAKKDTPLRESASFEPLSVKIWWTVWPVGELLKKEYINKKNFGDISPICPEAPQERISTKFCTAVAVVDVITCAKFFSDRLRDIDSVGVRKWQVPID